MQVGSQADMAFETMIKFELYMSVSTQYPGSNLNFVPHQP
jgi:hypothetical protein